MNVRLLPEAEVEYLEAAHWYESQRSGLGLEFVDEVVQVLTELETEPHRFPILESVRAAGPELRRCLLHRFPYYLVFTIGPSEVLVVAIAHRRQRPGYWSRRLS